MAPPRCEKMRIGCLAAAITSAGLVGAAEPPANAPQVEYLDTQVASADERRILLQSEIRITDGRQKWFSVYFHFRVDAKTALLLPNGKKFLALWGSLYPPGNVATAHYDNITMAVPLKSIAGAANLPRGKTTLLWGVCDLWDPVAKKYMGSGWRVRTPLFVTTDAAGNIVKTETFNTPPLRPRANDPAGRIKARKAALATTHAALRQTVSLHRAVDAGGAAEDILLVGDYQAPLRSASRGYFFEKIDTPGKAREFALIDFADDVVIKTEAQYQSIVKVLKARGWPRRHLAQAPPALGVSVEHAPPLGYRVEAAVLVYDNALKILRDVVHVRYNVGYDGRLGRRTKVLIKAPELPFGVEPGWKQPMPMEPVEYDKLLAGLLVDEGIERVPAYVSVTGEILTVPCAEGAEANSYKDPSP